MKKLFIIFTILVLIPITAYSMTIYVDDQGQCSVDNGIGARTDSLVYKSGTDIYLNDDTSSLSFIVPSLTDCNTIDTDSEGRMSCGTDDGGVDGSGDVFAWTTTAYGVSTSTILGFSNGFISQASSTMNGNLSFDRNNIITMSSSEPAEAGELIRLKFLNTTEPTSKAVIAFQDENANTKAWLVAHDYLAFPDNRHQHFSIELSDTIGQLQTRLAFPYDCDYDCDMTVNQSNLLLNRNNGQTNGNLFIDGGYLGSSGTFDFYPQRSHNGSIAFRIATTSNDIVLSAIGADRILLGENGFVMSGKAGADSTITINAPDQYDQILSFYNSGDAASQGFIKYDESAKDLLINNSITGANSDIVFTSGTLGEIFRLKGNGLHTLNTHLTLPYASTTAMSISRLANCDTIDTDANGFMSCGVDDGGAASVFPFTPNEWGNSTSTTLGFLDGFISTASSTINSELTVTATSTIGSQYSNVLINSRVLQIGYGSAADFVPTGGDNSAFVIINKPNAASDASILLSSVGDQKWEIGMAGDNNLYWKKVTGSAPDFSYASVLKMDYDTLRVGIGTEAPSSKLEIADDDTAARVDLRVVNKSTSGTDGTSLQLVAENDGHVAYLGTDAGLNGGQNIFLNYGAFGTGLFIDASGNVGSNDTSLTYDFESPTAYFTAATTTETMYSTGGFFGSLYGNANTATALAGNPTDCGANTVATAIDASGNLTCSITPLVSGNNISSLNNNSGYMSTAYASSTLGIDEKCLTVASTTFQHYDNIPIWRPNKAVTITDVYCETEGGAGNKTVQIAISDGTNALETITCDDDGAEDDSSIANGSFTAREKMEIDFATIDGTPDWVNVCISYDITP